jgi:hypothetical protein
MVKRAVDYRRNPDPGEPGNPIETLLLIQVDAHGRATEGFRFPIAGGTLECDIWAKDIFEDEEMAPFRFRYETEAGRVEIKANAFSSKWEDWSDQLARGTLVAFQGHTNTDVSQAARTILDRKAQENQGFGASSRWSIQAKNKTELSLVLQALPKPAGALRRDARLNNDRCGAVELARFPLETSFQTDGPCKGPIPVLFAKDPEATEAALSKEPENLHPGKKIGFKKLLHLDIRKYKAKSKQKVVFTLARFHIHYPFFSFFVEN